MSAKLIQIKTLKQYLKQKNVKKLRMLFDRFQIIDLATLVNQLNSPEDLLFIFRTCNSDHTAELFSHLTTQQQENLIHIFTDKQLIELLNHSYQDDIADFLSDMPANLVSKILKVADPSLRQEINQLLNYKPNSAGSIMTTEYITIPENSTIGEALEKIRKTGRDKETIYSNFIVDQHRFLTGIIYIEDVVFHDADQLVKDVMNKDFISCQVHTDQEEVSQLFKRYDLSVIPVLNESNHLVGIITIDDIVDVIEKEASEDILKMAAVQPLDDQYRQVKPFAIVMKSIPWIFGLMVIGAISTFTINQFQGILESVVILTAFIPGIMNTGGNTGNQSVAIITRAIAVKEITEKDFLFVIRKELRVSISTAFLTALFAFLFIFIELATGFIRLPLDMGITMYSTPWWIFITRISGLVSLTLLLAIILSKMLGSMIPLLALKLKKDPAVMSSPFLTTIIDFSSLLIYFVLANFLFNFF
ncbi:MAG: magnesium transporter [Bacilli bacterium]